MTELPAPLSRRDSQRRTRTALVAAARQVFSEDGYHAAGLARIARVAGYSKGAVYSNFDGKSALFLAVLDENLELADADPHHDPFDRVAEPDSTGRSIAEGEGYPQHATQGFALATLEFIASAARDETLAPQLHERMRRLLDRYETVARESRADDETLTTAQVGSLLAALDQGTGLLLLAGDVLPDRAIFTAGVRRLLDPARAADEDGRAEDHRAR